MNDFENFIKEKKTIEKIMSKILTASRQTSYPKKYKGVGYKVLILIDRSGNRMRKRIIKSRNREWFEQIAPFDISWVNPDWLKT